jgi:hypothetical protein
MLPSKPSFAIGMNVFGEVRTSHKSLSSSCTSSKGRTLKFNAPGFVQGVEVKLDEHKRTTTLFQQQQKIVYKRQIFILDFLIWKLRTNIL